MSWINSSGWIGSMLVYTTENITGSEFLTYLGLVMFFLGLCLMFKMPLEITIPILYPLLIVLAMNDANFMSILGVAIIYTGILIYQRFFTRTG